LYESKDLSKYVESDMFRGQNAVVESMNIINPASTWLASLLTDSLAEIFRAACGSAAPGPEARVLRGKLS
jgi:hypothetical protein